MDVSVIVVSYNTKDLLRRCLLSLFHETKGIDFEVFVVDNQSEDGSPDMVEEEYPSVNLIRNNENMGFARGNNIAIRKGTGRYFLLLNPDTYLVNNAIKALVDYMDEHHDVGASGSMLLDDSRHVQTVCRKFSRTIHEIGDFLPLFNRFQWACLSRDYLPENFNYEEPGETDYIQGACFMVRSEVVEKIGLLDERFFMYSEEEDWCYRIKKNGWQVMYVPSAVIVHYQGMSTRQRSREMQMELYRSKVKFFIKNYGVLTGQLFRLTLLGIMCLRIPYYLILSLILRSKREGIRKQYDQSLTILRAITS